MSIQHTTQIIIRIIIKVTPTHNYYYYKHNTKAKHNKNRHRLNQHTYLRKYIHARTHTHTTICMPAQKKLINNKTPINSQLVLWFLTDCNKISTSCENLLCLCHHSHAHHWSTVISFHHANGECAGDKVRLWRGDGVVSDGVFVPVDLNTLVEPDKAWLGGPRDHTAEDGCCCLGTCEGDCYRSLDDSEGSCAHMCPCASCPYVRAFQCMWLCVGVHAIVYGCACDCVWVCMWLCVGVHAIMCGCACDCVWMCMWLCVGVHVIMCGCACDYVWVCMWLCVGAHVIICKRRHSSHTMVHCVCACCVCAHKEKDEVCS